MMDIGITAAGATTMQEIVDLADHDGSSKGLKLGGTLVGLHKMFAIIVMLCCYFKSNSKI